MPLRMYVRCESACVYVSACVRACVRECVRACVRVTSVAKILLSEVTINSRN